MKLAPATEPRPAAAPVVEHSEFTSVAVAHPLDWSASVADGVPPGGGRITIDLGGRWERWADETAEPWFPEPGARVAAGPPGTGSGAEWRKVVVPDNFGFDGELTDHFGPVWYRRKFADPRTGAPDGTPNRISLRFAAVDYLADVWLNGEHVGHHEGAFAPFAFDVTDLLARDNEVVVCVQDPLEPLDPAAFFFFHRKRVIKGTLKYHDSRPGGLPGRMVGPLAEGEDPWVWTPEWGESMTTGGITGPVELVLTHDLSLAAVFVTPLEHDAATVQIATVVTNHTDGPRDAAIHFSIEGEHAAADVTVPPGSSRVDLQTALPHLGRWEPVHSPRGAPDLHELQTVLVVGGRVDDRRSTTFGLRTANVATGADGEPTHLEVNGHPVFVKAVNYIPWQHFAEVGRSFYDRDMRMISEAHGNSVGVHAHVQSPHAYDAADAAGLLVFQDFPLQWFYESGTDVDPGFVDRACRQIAELAYLLHPHPSVVYYACHNEPRRQFMPTADADDTPERDLGERHLDAALYRTLSAIDPSRHVHEASGIGADVHNYQGSLTGGSIYRVGEHPAWFVSEYGFWTIGPQFAKFGDSPEWPPDPTQMREWVSRLSFIGSTCGFAGLPSRYDSLAEWAAATEAYGAALAQYETEWFRAHRGAPFMGYRWHFWSDWWGYAGGGLVDVDRVTKRTYDAFRAASRPLLAIGLHDRSVVEMGTTTIRIVVVNDRAEQQHGTIEWAVHAAGSSVFAPDADGARIGLPMPPDPDALVAVERTRGEAVDRGILRFTVNPEATGQAGAVRIALEPGASRTLVLSWLDPVAGPQENTVHLHRFAGGATFRPGRTDAG